MNGQGIGQQGRQGRCNGGMGMGRRAGLSAASGRFGEGVAPVEETGSPVSGEDVAVATPQAMPGGGLRLRKRDGSCRRRP
jgi:hypothetical protein